MAKRSTNKDEKSKVPGVNKVVAKYEQTAATGRGNPSQSNSRKSGGKRGKQGKYRGNQNKQEMPEQATKPVENYNSWNDPEWYEHYPELLASAANIPFPNKPGMVVRGPNYNTFSNATTRTLQHPVPGVCSIKFDYSVGYSEDKASPASLASSQLFFRIRRAFSGSLATDAPDVFMYTMGLSQLFAYIAFLKRLYRTITRYSPQNQYFPTAIIKAMFGDHWGAVDVEEFQRNKVQLWNYINTLVRMTDMYKVPANMDIFKRHSFMCEKVYSDIDSMIGQNYVFSPNGWFRIIEQETNPGSFFTALEYVRFNQVPWWHDKIDTEFLYRFGLYLITSFNDWTDALTINGYIMRAFEGTDFYSVSLLGQDEMLEVEYSEEVLTQIHNLNIINSYHPADITQNPLNGAIICRPTAASEFIGSVILDVNKLAPTPRDITIASRLAATIDEVTGKVVCGSEVVTGLLVHQKSTQGTITDPVNIDNARLVFNYSTEDIAETIAEWEFFTSRLVQLLHLNQWNYFPRIYIHLGLHELFEDTWVGLEPTVMISQTVNPATATSQVLSDIHRVVLYSEFDSFL